MKNEYQKPQGLFDDDSKGCQNPENCTFNIASIQDDRKNKNNLGRNGGDLILAEDIEGWLTSGFMSLKDRGFCFTLDADRAQSGHSIINLTIRLQKAYINNLLTTSSENLVLTIIYSSDSQLILSKNYRGAYAHCNWTGSANEINSSFNHAFQKILKQVSCDLSFCCNWLQERAAP